MKRILFWVIAAVITAGLIPIIGVASEEVGDFEYIIDTKDNRQGIHIVSYTGNAENLIIPNIIEGHPVIGIGNPNYVSKSIFEENKTLKSVTISDGITHIWNGALSGCENLTQISIPESIVHIGAEAFRDCPQLISITIPKNVTSLGNTHISSSGSYSLYISNLFANCPNLIQIIVDKDNPHYTSEEGILYNKDKTKLILCPPGKSGTITIPNGVTEICAEAFRDCTGLTSITIPDGITNISRNAFYKCEGLTSIIIPDSVKNIDTSAFAGCIGLTQINIPGSIEYIGDHAFANLTSLKTAVLQYGIKSIGHSSFSGCTNLISISIPDSVEYIGNYAFKDCTNLTSLIIPDSVTTIMPMCVFENCTNLTKIRISDNVAHIGFRWFYGCSNLVSVNIPKNASKIDQYAFSDCRNLTSISIPDGVSSIGDHAFFNCTNLITVNIPDSVEYIGNCAFQNCETLSSLRLSKSIPDIPNHTFSGCKGLTSVDIPSNIAEIAYAAFENCANLKKVVFYNPNTIIEENGYIIPAVNTNPRDGGHPEIVCPPSFSGCDNLTVIYGFSGSTAQRFAWNQEKDFVPIAKIQLNESDVAFEVPPQIIHDRTLAPMRTIFEALDASVNWDDNTQTVTAVKDGNILILQPGNPVMKLNGEELILDVCPQLYSDTVLIPVRAVVESLNANVVWDAENQTALITTS